MPENMEIAVILEHFEPVFPLKQMQVFVQVDINVTCCDQKQNSIASKNHCPNISPSPRDLHSSI
jgi:hypothetical protein